MQTTTRLEGLHRLRAAVEKTAGLIAGAYFEDPESPRSCPACVVGVALRELPEGDFEAVLHELKGDYDNGIDLPWDNNKEGIQVLDTASSHLRHHYGLNDDQFLDLQEVNDEKFYFVDGDNVHRKWTPAERRQRVLDHIDGVIAGEKETPQ